MHLARRQTIFIGAFLVVVILFVTTFCMGVVRGASMEPTYLDGQVVLVRRRTPLNSTLHRNDVVLLQRDRGEVIIKRIFRLPGEEVKPGYPFLVGFAEPRGLSDYYEQEMVRTPGGPVTRYFVPQGYIAVLGDNPDVSEDSRFFGPVPVSSVLGSVVDAPGPPANLNERRGPPSAVANIP
jgi:signal peptidase I